MKSISHLVFFILFSSTLVAQQEIKLYTTGPKEKNELQKAESFRDKEFIVDISEARMFAFPVSKENATGTAVLICPGGGYSGISQIKEGSDIAIWFNKLGITAFVLYYRMPNSHSSIPLTDAQMALKIIRKRSNEWNIDKNKIGIMGFSAGGHLASTVGTHFKNTKQRPAFMILGYPVVTMNKEITHGGSRNNLLGTQPSDELIKLYSNELQVTKKTPPTFLVHAIDDKVVPIANSEQFFKALQNNNVPAEFHKYDVGGHGFGMRSRGIPVDNWPELLKAWLKTNKLTN
jgi:acetyl esterase/lipase